MLSPDNKIVHGLWIGSSISPLELLTIKSFIYHGHEFHLWVYEKNLAGLDNFTGLVFEDAGKIIPGSEVYARENADPACGGIGKGSYGSPFSDLFRYKLLYERGGWWTDMDVACLKPLDFGEPWFFRDHPLLQVVGTVMKCPKGSKVMLSAYNKTKELCNPNTTDWLLPNKILNEEIRKEGVLQYRRAGISNKDIWKETAKMIRSNCKVPENYCFIHWMNEEWRVRGINKNVILSDSTLVQMMTRYDVPFSKGNLLSRFMMNIRNFSWKGILA